MAGEMNIQRVAAMKALWDNDQCGFKSAVDQVADPEARLNLLNLSFNTMAPPGFKMDYQTSTAAGSVGHFKIEGNEGLFYELDFKRQANGSLQIVDEKPGSCSK